MLSHLYQNTILKNPKSIFVLLIVTLLSFGYFSKDFRLDASSETLLIEGDPDLKYLQEITERYGSKEFLVLTYSPNEGMVTESSINNLLSLKYKIQSLDWVHSVVTLLDIPLLNNSEAPLQERLESFTTLKDEGVDTERGFKEILNSPVFRNFVISEDGNTSGIIVYIKKNDLKDLENKTDEEIEIYKDTLKKKNHENITEIREIIKSYEDIGKIYLGGIPMIADDMMSFIKSDIIVFGLGVLLFIIATLWFVFRKLIWIIVPISSCFFSVLIMTGLLGLLGWKVTVISSNFIAIKFDDITVTFQPSRPSNPVIINTEKKQLLIGTMIQINFLKTNQSVAMINNRTPRPNTIISLLINDIISSAIIGIPPK